MYIFLVTIRNYNDIYFGRGTVIICVLLIQTQCLSLLSDGKHKFCSPSLATLFQACPLQDTQLPPKCVVSVCRCLLAKVAHTLSPCSPHRKKSHGVRSASSCGSPSVRLNESRCSADAYLGVHVRLYKNGGWYDRKLPEVFFFIVACIICLHSLSLYIQIFWKCSLPFWKPCSICNNVIISHSIVQSLHVWAGREIHCRYGRLKLPLRKSAIVPIHGPGQFIAHSHDLFHWRTPLTSNFLLCPRNYLQTGYAGFWCNRTLVCMTSVNFFCCYTFTHAHILTGFSCTRLITLQESEPTAKQPQKLGFRER